MIQLKDIVNTLHILSHERRSVIYGLAVIGFIAFIVAGMWLALYSTRFVPEVANRFGAAVVYLGSVFTPAPRPVLSVVETPAASTTISFGESTSTVSTSTRATTTSPLPATVAPRTLARPTAGATTSATFELDGVRPTDTLSGLPDLVVNVNSIGYLAAASANSFIASSTVPADNRPAIKFTIKNIGTNASGLWRFRASIPTQSFFLYQSPPQQSLNPGDSIDYTLGFDQSNRGSNQMISITANFDHAVGESNTNNNSASATVTVLGG